MPLDNLDNLFRDLRYTARTLRRDAGFTTFAVLIAGLGIGASATVFSVVSTLILRPLPFAEPLAAGVDWELSTAAGCRGRPRRSTTCWIPGGARAVAVGPRRLFRVLRRRRQPAQRQGRARTPERRSRVRQLLRHAGRQTVARPRLQRRRVQVERTESGDAGAWLVAAALRFRSGHCRNHPHAERSCRIMCTGSCRRHSTSRPCSRRAATSIPLLPVPAQPRDQPLGQHDGDDRASQARRLSAAHARGERSRSLRR